MNSNRLWCVPTINPECHVSDLENADESQNTMKEQQKEWKEERETHTENEAVSLFKQQVKFGRSFDFLQCGGFWRRIN